MVDLERDPTRDGLRLRLSMTRETSVEVDLNCFDARACIDQDVVPLQISARTEWLQEEVSNSLDHVIPFRLPALSPGAEVSLFFGFRGDDRPIFPRQIVLTIGESVPRPALGPGTLVYVGSSKAPAGIDLLEADRTHPSISSQFGVLQESLRKEERWYEARAYVPGRPEVFRFFSSNHPLASRWTEAFSETANCRALTGAHKGKKVAFEGGVFKVLRFAKRWQLTRLRTADESYSRPVKTRYITSQSIALIGSNERGVRVAAANSTAELLRLLALN